MKDGVGAEAPTPITELEGCTLATVFFVCPDFSFPSAGVRRLYRYAHQLRRRGLDSAIVHITGRFADFDADADRLEGWFRKLLNGALDGSRTS